MSITGIILAGGKSSRMGIDKGLMLVDGKPMIQYVIERLKPLVDELVIIANNEDYNQFGIPVYKDLVNDKGPLAGIYTGLFYSKSETNVVLSCDVPYVGSDLISFLIKERHNHQIIIPRKDEMSHQLIGVFSKSCEACFALAIENDQLKLINAYENLNLSIVNANQFDARNFINVNSINDLED